MTNSSGYILALDVGEKRIGVAIASQIARLARPLEVLNNTEEIYDEIKRLIAKENVETIVVGLPRNLNSSDSAQTVYARNFARNLRKTTPTEVVMQDEALTSQKAEAELRSRRVKYEKGDIDALAATYILEDYLASIGAMEKHQ